MNKKTLFPILLASAVLFAACNKREQEPIEMLSISGTVGGHDYVDLGLPSGTLWATCNVGASSPEESGDYFAWGETTPKSDYSWLTYEFGNWYQLTKYCNDSSFGKDGFADDKTVLDAEDDAATVNWGSDWRMPTIEEIAELCTECTDQWIVYNGVPGRKFTAPNGNSVFLPAAGYFDKADLDKDHNGSGLDWVGTNGNYWSATPDGDNPSYACYVIFYSDRENYVNHVKYNRKGDRYCGQSVRPVVKR
ncbi:MAG: hypothetical protein J6Y77_01730 [Paludibacteraceae bacterium]|nr:hypothetical protein [Paludibacteraceae bacterium]